MSIFPAVDLVTDVAQAADPLKRNAAVSRLSELSPARLRSEDEFARLVDGSNRSKAAPQSKAATATATTGASAGAKLPRIASAAGAAETFEAFVIQSTLETILPKAEEGLFGHGSAGSTWRSMLAEQIGQQIAKAGGLGMRSMLLRDLEHRAAASSSAPQSKTAG
ncbi:rod-binding protein [Methylosinus sp. Sm6]|uniref:rod-binding protein n=1 Tax=Methylosinus sp. Sm6 TaxID=2866948 RepID=UPI001C99E0EC|nr:rod-binding protein [Methylosinus sp. Sm6]MBY6240593.1 rod-binding protein [Methylosinus sp. Sm6]